MALGHVVFEREKTSLKVHEILERFENLNVWRRRGERAPHKPLLVLLTLGRLLRGGDRLVPYREVDPALRRLLEEFGPPRKSFHPEYPFWRLQNDGLWLVTKKDRLQRRSSNTDVLKSELIKHDVSGGFTPEVYKALKRDAALFRDVTTALLEGHFPETVHDDILSAVEISFGDSAGSPRRRRDPRFRSDVVRAYEHRCAICGLDLRLGTQDVALEAAHIRWKQNGGPDTVPNGLALCTLHHKVFDRGWDYCERRSARSRLDGAPRHELDRTLAARAA